MFKKGASGAPFDFSSAQKEPIMRLEQRVIMESNKYQKKQPKNIPATKNTAQKMLIGSCFVCILLIFFFYEEMQSPSCFILNMAAHCSACKPTS